MSVLNTLVLLGPLGPWELLAILAVIVLLFGAKKLPQIGKGFGEGIRNFRKGLKDDEADKAEDRNNT